MIGSFANKATENIFRGRLERSVPSDVAGRAKAKLDRIVDARQVEDLQYPPGNRLERLRGDREGQYSIRVNRKWRICFDFADGQALNVELSPHYE